jgi:hypothetical protein
MKARAKASGNPPRKSVKRQRDQARIVEAMAAKGLSADVIAACLNMDRNTLRGRHALSLHNGREKAKKQKAEAKGGDMTRAEMHAADAILGVINSHWQTPDLGNIIFQGLDGHGARTAAQAYAAWLRDGGRWNCSGLATNFSDAQVAEFVALKRAAEELLKDFPRVSLWSPTAATCQRSNSRPR